MQENTDYPEENTDYLEENTDYLEETAGYWYQLKAEGVILHGHQVLPNAVVYFRLMMVNEVEENNKSVNGFLCGARDYFNHYNHGRPVSILVHKNSQDKEVKTLLCTGCTHHLQGHKSLYHSLY